MALSIFKGIVPADDPMISHSSSNGFSHSSGKAAIDGSFGSLLQSGFNNLGTTYGQNIIKENLSGLFGTSNDPIYNGLTSGAGFMVDSADALADYLNGRGSGSGSGDGDPYGDIPYGSGSASASPGASPELIEYLDAPLATAYGMDSSTAYNEALANTAYQRKVADLKRAGLNPVLGISGSGAANFYGVPAAVGSSSGSGSLGSGKSTADIADTAKKLNYFLPTLANGLVNLGVTAVTKNGMSGFGAGMVAQNIVSGVLNGIRNFG